MPSEQADLIVVGAGPGGCATAYHAARAGARVLLLERSRFPRPKVCGDGLTPRAVRELADIGIDLTRPGWVATRGLRLRDHDHDRQITLDWPDTPGFPRYGLTRTRHDLDALLAEQAVTAGAHLHTATTVTGPLLDSPTGPITGVTATRGGTTMEFRAPLVVAASGVSARLPTALGIHRHPDRPVGAAVRRYYPTPPGFDERYLDIALGLRHLTPDHAPLPGYGWIFGVGDGRVNVGIALYNPHGRMRHHDPRALLAQWLRSTPPEWGLADERHADGPAQGAALPMGFNRTPHYHRGLLLVGDCGGMINPFSGEGIANALQSGHLAADTVTRALDQPPGPGRETALHDYAAQLHTRHDGYHRLGRRFITLLEHPRALDLGLHLLPHQRPMNPLLRLITQLANPHDHPTDRLTQTALSLARRRPRPTPAQPPDTTERRE